MSKGQRVLAARDIGHARMGMCGTITDIVPFRKWFATKLRYHVQWDNGTRRAALDTQIVPQRDGAGHPMHVTLSSKQG
jgi:hypothetical protein